MTDQKQITEITEHIVFGMLLALVGGFMDLYSYMVRGHVFATGQTGNFVLVAVHLANKEYSEMLHAIVPIVSFWVGIFAAWHMFYVFFKEKQLAWKRGILTVEIVILIITGIIPGYYPDLIANTLVSFAASLQFCTFRNFGTNHAYASIFCTGNMRSCAENYYKGIALKDKRYFKRASQYMWILIAFFIGAVAGAFAAGFLHEKAIWCMAAVLLVALLLSFPLVRQTK